MEALIRAIKTLGGAPKLAEAIGVSESAPHMWKKRGNVPAEYCPAIERATKKSIDPVTCEELRPDVDWAVLRGNRVKPRDRAREERQEAASAVAAETEQGA